jgi:hypothetical protein
MFATVCEWNASYKWRQRWFMASHGCEVKWCKVKWSEVMIMGEVYYHWFIFMCLYARGSVQYVVPLLFASVCYFLITWLLSFNILECLFPYFVYFFYFVYSVLLYCLVYCFSFCTQLSLSYLSTILPTTATGWKPNSSKSISYHLYKLFEMKMPRQSLETWPLSELIR